MSDPAAVEPWDAHNHAYPTQAEAIRKLGDAYNRTRLTPRVKRLFARWLAWTR